MGLLFVVLHLPLHRRTVVRFVVLTLMVFKGVFCVFHSRRSKLESYWRYPVVVVVVLAVVVSIVVVILVDVVRIVVAVNEEGVLTGIVALVVVVGVLVVFVGVSVVIVGLNG